ncbi:MAG: chain length determinant protein [Rhodospirillaceae bacterium]|nr:MAG: chain length determinant protein [Rhodospirillaceae bacterium]
MVSPSPLVRSHLRTQSLLLQSERVVSEVVRRLNLLGNQEWQNAFRESKAASNIMQWAVEQLLENMTARINEGSNIMDIRYIAFDPRIAALMANTFMAAFIDANLDMKIESAQRSVQWYDTQLAKLRRDFNDARERMLTFQRDAGILGSDSDSDQAQIRLLAEQLTRMRSELVAAEVQLQQMSHSIESVGDASLQSQTLSRMQGELSTVQSELARLGTEVGPRHPRYAALIQSQSTLQEKIREETKAIRRSFAAKVETLRNQVRQLETTHVGQSQHMIDQQEQRDQLVKLSREVDFRQAQLDSAANRAEALRMQGQISFVNVVPLDQAAPPTKPVFPRKRVILPLAAGFGLALGVVLALLIEIFDRRIRTPADLEYATGLHSIGRLMAGKTRRKRWFLGMGALSGAVRLSHEPRR